MTENCLFDIFSETTNKSLKRFKYKREAILFFFSPYLLFGMFYKLKLDPLIFVLESRNHYGLNDLNTKKFFYLSLFLFRI